MWYIYTLQYYTATKGENLAICNNVDGTKENYAKQNKSEGQR